MAEVLVNGSHIAYEVIGEGQPVILTPGGRFGKDVPGLRPLGERLAARMQVILWDRPNAGASDFKFTGRTESEMAADDLAGLLRTLDVGPAVLAGGSAGSRVSLIAAIRHPDVVSKLIMWMTSGGAFGTMYLAMQYILPYVAEAWLGGMEAVASMAQVQENLAANPRNREILLTMDAAEFIATLTRWLDAYIPKPSQPVPGVEEQDIRRVSASTLIFRNGDGDIYHAAEVSARLHELIEGSVLAEPPWPRDEWFQTKQRTTAGRGNFFDDWHMLATPIMAFIDGDLASISDATTRSGPHG